MANPNKLRGDRAEREVAAILSDLLGVKAQRALGAGRKEDVGDIFGIPSTVIQCAAWKDIAAAIRLKVPACELQQQRAGATFGATFLRRRGGEYVVVLSVDQWATYQREVMR